MFVLRDCRPPGSGVPKYTFPKRVDSRSTSATCYTVTMEAPRQQIPLPVRDQTSHAVTQLRQKRALSVSSPAPTDPRASCRKRARSCSPPAHGHLHSEPPSVPPRTVLQHSTPPPRLPVLTRLRRCCFIRVLHKGPLSAVVLASVAGEQRVIKIVLCLASLSVVALLTPSVCAHHPRKPRRIHSRIPRLRSVDPSSNIPAAFPGAITTVRTLLLRRPEDSHPRPALPPLQQQRRV